MYPNLSILSDRQRKTNLSNRISFLRRRNECNLIQSTADRLPRKGSNVIL